MTDSTDFPGLTNDVLNVSVFFGGPSGERSVSLHSARTFCDHLPAGVTVLHWFFVDSQLQVWNVDPRHLYRNTPRDFEDQYAFSGDAECIADFRPLFVNTAGSLNHEQLELLRRRITGGSGPTLVVPLIHGLFGEDGSLQSCLERLDLPFLGTTANACAKVFDKYQAGRAAERIIQQSPLISQTSRLQEFLEQNKSVAPLLIPSGVDVSGNHIHHQLSEHFHVPNTEDAVLDVVVKPCRSGSSLGVTKCSSIGDCVDAIRHLQRYSELFDGGDLLVEPLRTGTEFTVIVMENHEGLPVALLPTEIHTDGLFNYEKKYHPSTAVEYLCPPTFPSEAIDAIRVAAVELFRGLNLRHVARMDGWWCEDQGILFSDFNLISGMDHSSLIFQQAAAVGFSHRDLFRHLLATAVPTWNPPPVHDRRQKQTVAVLFGGESSERQISVQSGVNVWLKLQASSRYAPTPYLLLPHSRASDETVQSPHDWMVRELPHDCALFGTVENIDAACDRHDASCKGSMHLQREIQQLLRIAPDETDADDIRGQRTLSDQLTRFREQDAIVFNVVHGGIGENGTAKQWIEDAGIRCTGSSPDVARLCMNKTSCVQTIKSLDIDRVGVTPHICRQWANLIEECRPNRDILDPMQFGQRYLGRCAEAWTQILHNLSTASEQSVRDQNADFAVIVKPTNDGSSTGVARLTSSWSLAVYLWSMTQLDRRRTLSTTTLVPSLTDNDEAQAVSTEIPLPQTPPPQLLFEEFVVTPPEHVIVEVIRQQKPDLLDTYNWIEVTCGIVSDRHGHPIALPPSMTVTDSSEILTQSAKFLKGDGINRTPIDHWALPASVDCSGERSAQLAAPFQQIAEALRLNGPARIDAFVPRDFLQNPRSKLRVIEININPALTPATVLFHQAAERFDVDSGQTPTEFLESVLDVL